MPKQETGITGTGEAADPLARKSRRAASSGPMDAQAMMGDGMMPSDGTRSGLNRLSVKKPRRGAR